MKKESKDLLRFEKDYFQVYQQEKGDHKSFIIENLLNKQKKPQFQAIQESSFQVLCKARDFLPQFQTANNILLSDENLIAQKQIDKDIQKVKLSDIIPDNPYRILCRKTGQQQKKVIDMDIYLGVFDVKEKTEETKAPEMMKKKPIIEEI